MSAIAPEPIRHQLASDPARHVWVAASAGTGKTRALTDRITRLLLAGCPPESILAITFTRTAAAEMKTRITRRLADWARMPEPALVAALGDLGEPDAAGLVDRARTLFATLLDTPGGLQIQTIHGFAQSLLAAFPLEAGLSPGTQPLDDRSARLLLDRAFAEVLAAARAPGGAGLAGDLARLAVESHEGEIARRLPGLAASAPAYALLRTPAAVEPWLRRWLGLPLEGALDGLLAAVLAPPAFDDGLVARWADAFETLGTEAKQAEATAARAWLALAPQDRAANLPGLLGLVWTGKDEPRKLEREVAKVPALGPALEALLPVAEALKDRAAAIALVAHAGAWLRVGMELAGAYGSAKRAAGAVDYDDMIALAADLLHRDGMVGWINRRLDRRIRHLLVDEAQDTNDAQWRIVDALVAEFDAGEGQQEGPRTRFAVGDYKQAIFGFQGTDPKVFEAQRGRWLEATTGGGRPLLRVDLDRNFRSGPAVLALVDQVIAYCGPESLGLAAGETVPRHQPHRAAAAGHVLLLPPWNPPVADADGEEEEGEAPADPDFADGLARRIAGWLAPGPDRLWLGGQKGADGGAGRWAGPGDILILLRARTDLMARLVAALHARGVPVAGVDRMLLAQPIAVQDLLSLVRFVLQPADDLALAEVLVSPLGGLDQDALYRLRLAGGPLWSALGMAGDPAAVAARAFLEGALRMADQVTPHDFLAAVLADGGRARFLARLGREAEDGLDTLLAEALLFETRQPPTLQGFLRWLDEGGTMVKRDADSAPGLVRIMTVHGAKGLQAPVVVLADALRGRKGADRLLMVPVEGGGARLPIVYGGKERLPASARRLAEAADAADRAEDRRLLYVALTRAEDVLVVAGQAPRRQPQEPSWHAIVRGALEGLGARSLPAAEGEEPALLLEGGVPVIPRDGRAEGLSAAPAVPAWARTLPPGWLARPSRRFGRRRARCWRIRRSRRCSGRMRWPKRRWRAWWTDAPSPARLTGCW